LGFGADVALAVTVICIFRSTRIVRGDTTGRSREIWLLVAAAIWSALAVWAQTADFAWQIGKYRAHVPQPIIGIAAVALLAAFRLSSYARRRNSAAFTLLAVSLAIWAPLLAMSSLRTGTVQLTIWTDVFAIAPQVLLGVTVVLVVFEKERRAVEENLLGFSSLEMERGKLLDADDISPNVLRLLNRVLSVMKCDAGALLIAEEWRSVLPSVSSGLPQRLIAELNTGALSEFLGQMARSRGGLVSLRDLEDSA